MDALHVSPPEVNRDEHREAGGECVYGDSIALVQQPADFVEQRSYILTSADNADRSRENVIEYQRRDGEFRGDRAHAVMHDDVYAAPHEHAAALQVDASHSKAKEHHAQDKLHGADLLYSSLFRRAARIERGRRKVTENDGRTAPETDEGQSYRRCDYNLWRRRRKPPV